MAGVSPETYVSVGQLLTRINGRRAVGELVTGNYSSLLGVPALRERMLRPSDSERPARAPPGSSGLILKQSMRLCAIGLGTERHDSRVQRADGHGEG